MGFRLTERYMVTHMGKGKRSRANAEIERKIYEEKMAVYKAEQKKSRRIKILVSLCLVAVILISVFGSIGFNTMTKNGSFMRGATVVASKDFKINACMAQYLYNSTLKNFAESNASYLTQLGLDTTKDLNEQTCAYDEEISWHDYFINNTKTQFEEIVIMAQSAKNEGMELSDTDLSYVEESMAMFDSLAEDEGITVREYIDQNYGTQVSLDDIRECIEITQLASNYKTKYDESLKYTDSEISGYWSENKGDFFTCDYIYLTIPVGETEGKSDAEVKQMESKAKKQALKLADAKSYTDFKKNLENYLTDAYKKSDKDATDEEIKSNVSTLVSNYTVSGEGYDVSTDRGEWLFSDKRKSGDTTVILEDEGYTALCMISPAAKDTSQTKNVRHILLSTEDYEDESECEQEANRLLKEWRNGEKTEASFAALAKEHSSDPGSSQVGGLYENVTEGTMVEAFNDWIFAKSRKAGDVDVVKTEYGCHVMYFVGDGYDAWQAEVVEAMKTDDYQEYLEKQKKEIGSEVKEGGFQKINQVKAEEDTSSN